MQFQNILFLDIETVSAKETFSELTEDFQYIWSLKARQFHPERALPPVEKASEYYEQKAGIFAEFAKIVCISVGYCTTVDDHMEFRLKSFAHDDEKVILESFCQLLDSHYNNPNKHAICGHNIKEFDVPFMCRRLVINGMELPKLLQVSGKKPWQIGHLIDTMELWRFGDYKNYTSLVLLATTLGISSPKDDIDGSMVGKVYWEEKDLERIAVYCQKDVVTVAQILLKMNRLPIIEKEHILVINQEE